MSSLTTAVDFIRPGIKHTIYVITVIIPERTTRFVRAFAEPQDDTVTEMEKYGENHGPTTTGREVGQLFRVLTKLTGAERVSKFGSGYGYSAYWFALGLPPSGEVVLTDIDRSNLDRVRSFFEDAVWPIGGDSNSATLTTCSRRPRASSTSFS